MFGQALRHGSRRRDMLSRELDRYPKQVVVDFRNCEATTLKKYIDRFKLDCPANASVADLARIVARHYYRDFDVVEEEVISNFSKFLNDYPGEPSAKRHKQGKRYGTRSARDDHSEEEDTQPLYCVCNRPSFGEMVGCDNKDCKIEWFHISCVGIQPDSLKGRKWFCPDCQAKTEKVAPKDKDSDPPKNAPKETKQVKGRGGAGAAAIAPGKEKVKPKRKPPPSSHQA